MVTDRDFVDKVAQHAVAADREIVRLRDLLARVQNYCEQTLKVMDEDVQHAAEIAALHLGFIAGLASNRDNYQYTASPVRESPKKGGGDAQERQPLAGVNRPDESAREA